MVKVIITGAAGRMGQRLVSAVLESSEVELAGAIETPDHPLLGQDAGRVAGLSDAGVNLVGDLAQVIDEADVLIEFTWPETSLAHIGIARQAGKAVVCGTTGLTDEQKAEVRKMASTIPCVLAPNMSQGVNLMFELVRWASEVLGRGFDIEVIEAHHKMKKDAPSGTAMRLGEILAGTRGGTISELGCFHREGMIGERSSSEIGMQTIRAGDIVGEHTVLFAGSGERIEITHRAHNRDTFVRGAIRACAWVVDQKPGLYDMQDILGLRRK